MKFSGFDWDGGNWPKCGKHGVSREEIEESFEDEPAVRADPHPAEPRLRAIGKARSGRYVFLVFMLRTVHGRTLIRPIGARYMHKQEIAYYESSSSQKDAVPSK